MKINKSKKTVYAVILSILVLLTAVTVIFLTQLPENTPPSVTEGDAREVTTQKPVPVPEKTVKIGTAGDVLIHVPIYENAKTGDGNYNFDHVFTGISDTINEYDYFIANLETTFGGTENNSYSGFPRFNSPDSLADALKKAGVDMVLTANNHTYDTDTEGILRTIDVVKNAGLDFTGTRKTESDKQYIVKNIEGISFGFICYTYETPVTQGYKALNGILLEEEAFPLVNSFVPDSPEGFFKELEENIQKMRDEGADVITVFVHWGDEYSLSQNSVQESIALGICDLGADVIIGGHPHVVQPVELITSSDKTHNTVCLYSMGNFVSNQRRSLMGLKTGHTEDGLIFGMNFTLFSDGHISFDSIEVIPTWVHLYYENTKAVHSIVPLTGDIRADAEKSGLNKSSDGISLAEASRERTLELTGEGTEECNNFLASQNSMG